MKSGRTFVLLLGILSFLVAGSGCKVNRHHRRVTGVIISTEPHGRLAPGEIDNMSGKVNEMPEKKKEKEQKKETELKHKKTEEKVHLPFAPNQSKKNKRR
jgi:hypothetical protein